MYSIQFEHIEIIQEIVFNGLPTKELLSLRK